MDKNFDKVISLILGGSMIIFGLNKFLGFINVAPPDDKVAQVFLGAMFSSYLFVLVAIAEILGGILLIFPKNKFLGWCILSPVVLNIMVFHFAHDFIGNGIWLVPSSLFIVLGYRFKDRIKTLALS